MYFNEIICHVSFVNFFKQCVFLLYFLKISICVLIIIETKKFGTTFKLLLYKSKNNNLGPNIFKYAISFNVSYNNLCTAVCNF